MVLVQASGHVAALVNLAGVLQAQGLLAEAIHCYRRAKELDPERETIARDPEHYVDLAVQLAEDLPRLAKIRAGLREQVARSPLCDGPRFAGNFMGLLRGVWHQWCANHG
jgi:predicted O-linked N-acetylglucosamine transferase (SPINDLY family)